MYAAMQAGDKLINSKRARHAMSFALLILTPDRLDTDRISRNRASDRKSCPTYALEIIFS